MENKECTMGDTKKNHTYPDNCPFVDDHDLLTRMDEKLESIQSSIYDKDIGILACFAKLNGRVKKLEIWRAGLVGGLAVISIAVSILVILLEHLSRHPEAIKIP